MFNSIKCSLFWTFFFEKKKMKKKKHAGNAYLGLKHGCIQTFEKPALRCRFTMSLLLSEIYFKNFNFFPDKRKCKECSLYVSFKYVYYYYVKIFSFYLFLSEINPKLKHKIFSQNESKRPYFFFSEIWCRSHSILE